MEPMTPEQWAEASTRGALVAQLRGQREAGEMILTELRECREDASSFGAALADSLGREARLRKENDRLRKLLRPIWQRTFAETFRPEIPDRHWFQVGMTAGELRAIAALFVEEDDA